eukprot:1159792-Pelagomonas_calceolata.AAC.23
MGWVGLSFMGLGAAGIGGQPFGVNENTGPKAQRGVNWIQVLLEGPRCRSSEAVLMGFEQQPS